MAPVIPGFTIKTEISVGEAATVICLRETKGRKPTDVLRRDRVLPPGPEGKKKGKKGGAPVGGVAAIFNGVDELDFCFRDTSWEVLMGQNECVNWMKTTGLGEKDTKIMRYPGEYKFAGGALDKGESFRAAAQRELAEEFIRPCNLTLPEEGARLRPFAAKQTMPIRDRSDIMWNFIALASENPWLENLDIEAANAGLAAKRARFEKVLGQDPEGKAFFSLPQEEKEALAPEVRELRWVPLSEAVMHCFTSMLPLNTTDGSMTLVNDWQAQEFGRLKITKRDPMFLTGATLVEIASFPSNRALLRHIQERTDAANRPAEGRGTGNPLQPSPVASEIEKEEALMEKERRECQWTFPGMKDAEFQQALRDRRQKGNGMKLIDAMEVIRLREERAKEDLMLSGSPAARL